MTTCEIVEIRSPSRGRVGVNVPCESEATHLYANGAYRRLECDQHAALTRSFIRWPSDPEAPRIAPLTAAQAATVETAEGERCST